MHLNRTLLKFNANLFDVNLCSLSMLNICKRDSCSLLNATTRKMLQHNLPQREVTILVKALRVTTGFHVIFVKKQLFLSKLIFFSDFHV